METFYWLYEGYFCKPDWLCVNLIMYAKFPMSISQILLNFSNTIFLRLNVYFNFYYNSYLHKTYKTIFLLCVCVFFFVFFFTTFDNC